MSWNSLIQQYYPNDCQPLRVESLNDSGGFSGAQLWRLSTPRGRLCLRRWPAEHPTAERLREIHTVLFRVAELGFALLPTPIRASTGASFISYAGHLWELTPWMPGEANRQEPISPERLAAAMTTLAHLHLTAEKAVTTNISPADPPGDAATGHKSTGWLASYRDNSTGFANSTAPIGAASPQHIVAPQLAPTFVSRLAQLQSIVAQPDFSRELSLDMNLGLNYDPDWRLRATEMIPLIPAAAYLVWQRMSVFRLTPAPLIPCLRDIWSEHVLFTGDQVTGVVDVGAMRPDHPATDIARLLGSLARLNPIAWRRGLEAYQSVRELSASDRQLIDLLDQAAVALSGLSWLRWICLERRTFPDHAAVTRRLDEILLRLRPLSRGETWFPSL